MADLWTVAQRESEEIWPAFLKLSPHYLQHLPQATAGHWATAGSGGAWGCTVLTVIPYGEDSAPCLKGQQVSQTPHVFSCMNLKANLF